MISIFFISNGQLFPSLSPSAVNYLSPLWGAHSLAKTMFVVSLTITGLKCPLHLSPFLCVFNKAVELCFNKLPSGNFMAFNIDPGGDFVKSFAEFVSKEAYSKHY